MFRRKSIYHRTPDGSFAESRRVAFYWKWGGNYPVRDWKAKPSTDTKLIDGDEFERMGPCDVTSKDDLQKLVDEISKKEKYINLLSMYILQPTLNPPFRGIQVHELTRHLLPPSFSQQCGDIRAQGKPCLWLRLRTPINTLVLRGPFRLGFGVQHQRNIRLLHHRSLPSPFTSRLQVRTKPPRTTIIQRHRHLQHERNDPELPRPFFVQRGQGCNDTFDQIDELGVREDGCESEQHCAGIFSEWNDGQW